MKKKRVNITIDETTFKEIKAWLAPKGLTFSAYVESLVSESLKSIKILDGVEDLKDVSLGQLTRIFASMAEEMKDKKKK